MSNFTKKICPTIQLSKFTRLFPGGNEYAWQFSDEGRVIVMYFKILAKPAEPVRDLKLADLNEIVQGQFADTSKSDKYFVDFRQQTHLVNDVDL